MNIRNKIRAMGTKGKIALAVLSLTALAGVPIAVKANYFPERPVYDYNKVGVDCNKPNEAANQNSRCGSMTGPVFNSFINSPSYGDERQFMDGRMAEQPAPYNNTDTVSGVTNGSKQVVLRMFVHNNANQATNDDTTKPGAMDGIGVARNARVTMELPNSTDNNSAFQAVGAIKADNASEVTDTVFLTGDRKFSIKYNPGTAKLLRGTNVYPLSDSIVSTKAAPTNGALIGDKVMDGNLPGCFDYEALVEITVTITPEESNRLQLVKEVKKVGEAGWKKEVAATPGEEVEWLLTTKNIGLDQLTNVTVRDILPPHLKLDENSVEIINANQQSFPQSNPDPLFGNGFDLGTYPSGGGRYIRFKTVALDDFDNCRVRVQNVAKARATQIPVDQELSSDADVVITKENCEPEEETPLYSCDLLNVVKGTNRTATYTTNASATGGATIKNYIYAFGDGETLTTDKASVNHTYKTDGEYSTKVTVQFAVGNEVKTAEGAKCVAAVSYTTPGTPPGTPGKPGTPTTLPETGAGSTIAIFIAVTAISTGAYYTIARRAARF